MLRFDRDEKLKLDEQDSITLNSTLTLPNAIRELPTRTYIDSIHEKNRNRPDLSSVVNDQDNEIDSFKLTKLDSITVNRSPISDIQLAKKNYVDDSLGGGNFLRINPTLENYLKVSVRNDVYILIKFEKIQTTDATITNGYSGGYPLQQSTIKSINKNINGKTQNSIKSTKKSSPTSHSGATNSPAIEDSIMYVETSRNSSGSENKFLSFEPTDNIQISNISFYYNRYPILSRNSIKSKIFFPELNFYWTITHGARCILYLKVIDIVIH